MYILYIYILYIYTIYIYSIYIYINIDTHPLAKKHNYGIDH